MKPSTGRLLQATALILALAGTSGIVLAQDKEGVKNREALMKGQGKVSGASRPLSTARGPGGSRGRHQFDPNNEKDPRCVSAGNQGSLGGKYSTKPDIWSDWNKFVDSEKRVSRADLLLVAVKATRPPYRRHSVI
jgi:cytochrome c556